MIYYLLSDLGTCMLHMFFDHALQFQNVIFRSDMHHIYHAFINLTVKRIILIQHIRDTAAHTCSEVLADRSKNCNTSTGHVFTAVISDTFCDCHCTRITDTETLSGESVDKCLTICRTIKCHITDDHIFIVAIGNFLWREYHKLTTGQTFSEIVVAVTGQFQCQSLRNKCTKALSSGTFTVDHKMILRQSFRIMSGNLRTKDRTKGTVYVRYLYMDTLLLLLLQRLAKFLQQYLLIQCFFQFKIKLLRRVKGLLC